MSLNTLNELVTRSTEWDAQFSSIALPPDELRFDTAGLRYSGQVVGLNEADRSRLFNNVNAPSHYLEKLSPVLQSAALSEHALRGDFGKMPVLVTRNGAFETIVRGELQRLAIVDVIRSVQEALGNESDRLFVTRISGYPEGLDVDLVSASKEIAVRPGDIVQSGLHIAHEPFGNQATQIESFVYRLVCTNGLTRRFCKGEGVERTRRLPASAANSRELQMAQIRRLARRNWDGLQEQLEALRAISGRPARVKDLLKQWLRNARITAEPMFDRLVSAWEEEGGENTFYGAINALTRVATHHLDLSERQRRTLASLAGVLAFSERHICERCFSILAGSATESTD
jgi:hypothetical protein